MLESYKKMVYYLGELLGSSYKIVLFDLTQDPPTVVAIANGTLTGGAGIGAQLTTVAQDILNSEAWRNQDYNTAFYGKNPEGKTLKSSYFFIKDKTGEKPIGMLCINIALDGYIEVYQDLLSLVGLRDALQITPPAEIQPEYLSESFSDIADTIQTTIKELFGRTDTSRLTQEEKTAAVEALRDKGIFHVKRSVQDVAVALNCSTATVYRYLSKLSKEK